MSSPDRTAARTAALLDDQPANVRLLLRAGVPAGGAHDGARFVDLAACHGRAQILDLLVEHGAPLDGEVLEWAADGGGGRHRPSRAVVERVLAAAPPDPATASRALRFACVAGGDDVVALLVTGGADPNAADPTTGDTPLSLAVLRGHAAVVDALLGAGADPTQRVPPLPIGDAPPGVPVSLAELALQAGHPDLARRVTAPR